MNSLLTTTRLIISKPSLNDLDNLFTLQSNSEVMRFIGNGKRDRNEVMLGLEKAIYHVQKHQFSLGSVFVKDSQEFIGRAGLIYFNYDDNQPEVELAYALLPQYWGKGYATEITTSLIDFAFRNLNMQKLIAVVHPENASSQNVLIKCGMSNAGKINYWNKEVMKFEINKS
ncbi:GNAT family N-acetyltransferase [Fluoribacter gormanii]|uniref:N-acetyltransferase n=1 Tax=Legionella qingyii TaxID=2184757 RepID=A0A317U2R5_9GAMM|nr:MULTISPECIES: GNAT family N-acetyltransferase [Legionellaceae]MCW8472342.1 GNAT family N-acetyltransferase [Fluoribacter gormanii]PWY54782.1 GNAT family N-acetyltransferase [Legionella qingyii]RUR20856.1 N-acetyltransferase [Legionella qingyii]